MERQLGDTKEYPCPHCGNSRCFAKELKIWPISYEVFMKHFFHLQDFAGE
jgi:hypothetical protein